MSRVWVQVDNSQPPRNPYPWQGFDRYRGHCRCLLLPHHRLFQPCSFRLQHPGQQRPQKWRQREGGAMETTTGGHPRCAVIFYYYNCIIYWLHQNNRSTRSGEEDQYPLIVSLPLHHQTATITGASNNRRPTAEWTQRTTMLQGGTHLLAAPFFTFRHSKEVYAYTSLLCHYSYFRRTKKLCYSFDF